MIEGSFFVATYKAPRWLPFYRAADKGLDAKLAGVLKRSERNATRPTLGDECNDSASNLSSTLANCTDLAREGSVAQSRPHSIRIGAGGYVVKPGVEGCIDLYRVHPYVYQSDTAFIILSGYLSNVDDLVARVSPCGCKQCDDDTGSPFCVIGDKGTKAAAALLQAYQDGRTSGQSGSENLMVLLSELQGQYAFVLYDSVRRAVFAARDPSGKEQLYYHSTPDGYTSFTNRPIDVPEAGVRHSSWYELPPGYFVSGRHARLHQFALTTEELIQREFLERTSPDRISFFDAPIRAVDVCEMSIEW